MIVIEWNERLLLTCEINLWLDEGGSRIDKWPCLKTKINKLKEEQNENKWKKMKNLISTLFIKSEPLIILNWR